TICKILVDPENPRNLYAASLGHVFVAGANRGVFKSADGGAHWTKILFVNDQTGVADLAMDPRNPEVLYAAAWQAYRTPWKLSSGGPGSGIYKTSDGGAHWTNISSALGLGSEPLGKIGVAVAPSSPNVVYAIVQAKDGGVFRSDDAGAHFTRVSNDLELRQRAFYYMKIVVNPKDPDTVYVPNVNFYVSQDGGKNFKELDVPHGDHHTIWINPDDPNILLEGNDGGATVSTDGGKSWSSVHNQPTGQFYHVNLDDQFPFHVYGAQQDEGSFAGPSASPDGVIPLSAWQSVADGESTVVVPQPGTPNLTYGSGYYSIFVQYDLATGQYRSVTPWPNYMDGAASNQLRYRFAWTHPILFSPADHKTLFVGSQYVQKSTDYGLTWKTISPDLTRNSAATEGPTGGPIDLDQTGAEVYPWVSAIGISPLDGDVIWAGSSDGLVHVTTDGGAHWQAVRPPQLPAWALVDAIEPSHFAKGTAYLAARRYMWDDFRPYVYETTDYGRHWTAITNGLPADEYVFDVVQDPNDAKLLFLAAKNTVYVSFDGGADWQPLTLNLPRVQVRGIAINSREGEVAIATHGRAFWILDDLALLEAMTGNPAVTKQAPALFTPGDAWLTYSYGGPTQPDGVGANPPFGATVFFHIPENYDGKTAVTLSFADANGRLVRSFPLHAREKTTPAASAASATPAAERALDERRLTAIDPGMNRFQWNLRYPDAVGVTGFYPPEPAGGLAATLDGPQVLPGSYRVTLDYGGDSVTRNFRVALDPRLHASQSDLEASLALQFKIQNALDTLDESLDKAIATRARLAAAVSAHRLSATQAAGASSVLGAAIASVVQLDIHSSEGDVMKPMKLHSHLAYLGSGVGIAYVRPTAAQYAVFRYLRQQANDGEQRLAAAITAAEKLLP
ncbi:MAG TPA: exo-alpha-sialidase, partial [Gammaproteobacteria bacterium]|nr:exo-alpha-sialidase [Gammaproteobacteria bacterium]